MSDVPGERGGARPRTYNLAVNVTEVPVLPTQPGCYLFVAPDGEVLYVGKAINLRSRVRKTSGFSTMY